jgi:hypothetical protein
VTGSIVKGSTFLHKIVFSASKSAEEEHCLNNNELHLFKVHHREYPIQTYSARTQTIHIYIYIHVKHNLTLYR